MNSWILPHESNVKLEIENLDLDFDTSFIIGSDGYLDPVVYKVDIDFGKTMVYHDNKIIAFFMHQIFEFGTKVVQNSLYFLGGSIFSSVLGPIMDRALNHYRMPLTLKSPLLGQTTQGHFVFDYRNVYSPVLYGGYADFFFAGELLHGDFASCDLEHDNMDFANSATYSQLVISESAATCALNSLALSPIGLIQLDATKLNQLFEKDYIKFDSGSLAKYLPVFQRKIGDADMKAELSFKNIKVMFGQFDSDLILEYTACVSFIGQSKTGVKELMFDEFKMITTMDMQAEDDVMQVKVLNHKLDVDTKFGSRDKPIRNGMDLTTTEYKEFLSTFSYSMNYFKNWLNTKHLPDGIRFPWTLDEFNSNLRFQEKSMHIMLEVEDNAALYLEDKFWDGASKP